MKPHEPPPPPLPLPLQEKKKSICGDSGNSWPVWNRGIKKDCHSFAEGYFCLSKQLSILFESSLFAKVLFIKYVSIAELCSCQTKHCSP